jgi:putative inorganic carbon (hco3(-)) transporter
MRAASSLSHNEPADLIAATVTNSRLLRRDISRRKLLGGAYASLLLFMVVHCSRPQDWIPGLSVVPLAKIAVLLALLSLAFSIRHICYPLPREVVYLILLNAQLFATVPMSPVWAGGAFQKTVGFTKIVIIVIVLVSAVNTAKRLHGLLFIHAVSIATISAVAVWKGHLASGRLEGIGALEGNYSNPNDLALAIVVSLPLCLALLFLSTTPFRKAAWALAVLVMMYAVILTGSRGGFLALIVSAVVCLWEFATRRRRRYLFVVAALAGVILWQSSSGMRERLMGTFSPDENVDAAAAYASTQERQQLFWRSIQLTMEHPLFGVGPGNFQELSDVWHVTHNTYTEMSSEGGLPAFILYVLILWRGFNNVRTTKHLSRGQGGTTLLAGALRASLAGFVAGSAFTSVAFEFLPYFLVAYTTALFLIAKDTASTSKEPEPVQGI